MYEDICALLFDSSFRHTSYCNLALRKWRYDLKLLKKYLSVSYLSYYAHIVSYRHYESQGFLEAKQDNSYKYTLYRYLYRIEIALTSILTKPFHIVL